MELSYWEYKSWFSNIDFAIVGSGIVGLSCALELRKKHPKASILILEKGTLPQGASTKNAGFACFGSISEILDDLLNCSEKEVIELIEKRYKGILGLRELLGDRQLDFQQLGGYELFSENNKLLMEESLDSLNTINSLLFPIFGKPIFSQVKNPFDFDNVSPETIFNSEEGQLDTGKMMSNLLKLAHQNNINIINSLSVKKFEDLGKKVKIVTDKLSFTANQLFLATNGFSEKLGIDTVKPARAQVLITNPIPNLTVKGTFHLDKGYYYFRNIDDRILLGGGRNLDFETEETTEFGQTNIIQYKLEEMLSSIILPKTSYRIEQRWSGIMGIHNVKTPIIRSLSSRVHYGVRLGGMGIAIGHQVGKQLANLID